jgi:hypothetical protein
MSVMTPTDLRNSSFDRIRQDLHGRLQEVYHAWLTYGPGTTRQLAGLSGIDILNVRPRTTDLVGLGLVMLSGSVRGEGIYMARTQAEWEAWRQPAAGALQAQLNLI